MRAVRVGAVILAAGYSRRLGWAKQDVVLAGEPLLVRAARTALEASLAPVIAVVSEVRWVPVLEALGLRVLLNEQAAEGMASSVRLGITALASDEVDGAVILTCDQPLLRAEHLQALCEHAGRVTGSAYAGRVGVPAYFPAAAFPSLVALQGDAGARALLQGAAAIADEELALDIDTEDDLRRAEQRFENRGA